MPSVRAILPPVSAYPRARPSNAHTANSAYSIDKAKSESASRTSMRLRLRRCAISALAAIVHSLTIRNELAAQWMHSVRLRALMWALGLSHRSVGCVLTR